MFKVAKWWEPWEFSRIRPAESGDLLANGEWKIHLASKFYHLLAILASKIFSVLFICMAHFPSIVPHMIIFPPSARCFWSKRISLKKLKSSFYIKIYSDFTSEDLLMVTSLKFCQAVARPCPKQPSTISLTSRWTQKMFKVLIQLPQYLWPFWKKWNIKELDMEEEDVGFESEDSSSIVQLLFLVKVKS